MQPGKMARSLSLLLCAVGASTTFAGSKPPVYPYQIDQSSLSAAPLTTVVIASGPLGKPPRQYLRAHEQKVDEAVAKYLKKAGIAIVDNRAYQAALDNAHQRLGDPYDAATDHIDMNAQQRILAAVLGELGEKQPAVEAVVFTELVSREVYFSSGLKRYARWDGVSRSPLMQGPGQGVPIDFNWAQPFEAVSLGIYVFTVQGKRIFMSAGGISLTEAIDTRRSRAQITRYRNLLSNGSQIKEGVKIALHPLVPMKRYPG